MAEEMEEWLKLFQKIIDNIFKQRELAIESEKIRQQIDQHSTGAREGRRDA